MAAKRRKQMTDEAFEAVAQRFRVLSDPLRLKILYHIGQDERTVNELVELTGGTQSNVSKHLSVLLTHGLVRRRRQGTSAYYAITDHSIFDLCDQVCGGIDRTLENRRKAFQ
ncbi:MAG: metalloregulator ArsR/SmtB family transcription factor [Candidatus Krumholzibacteria bacterium]|nr:metalloregulator ArsR/SmtB family transcription factor [Candidatus Krumholzibacteria bacterium]